MSRAKKTVSTPAAPAAIGPYSQAVAHGGLLFCSGQIPLNPQSGEIVGSSATEQAARCLDNLTAVCKAAGTTLADALRITIYMVDLSEFAAVNDLYASYFEHDPPARVTIGVAALPKGALIEIDAIVAIR